jgi:hypothetical protein
LLQAYDTILTRIRKAPKEDREYSVLNHGRSEILVHAINAFMFAGPISYPASAEELSEVLDLLAVDPVTYGELNHLQFPDSLQQLVDCGILSHLPASPYGTGSYLSELPAQGSPGDVCYMPIPVYKRCWNLEPGLNEGELLLIFDKAYESNRGLLDAEGLAEGCYGDFTKYFKAAEYDNICYILLNDRDEAEKQRIR